jgi:hypothetical protein
MNINGRDQHIAYFDDRCEANFAYAVCIKMMAVVQRG